MKSAQPSGFQRVLETLLKKTVLASIGIALSIVFLFAGSHKPRESVVLWFNFCLVVATLTFLCFFRVVNHSAARGQTAMAKMAILPAFEILLWLLVISSLVNLDIMVSRDNTLPHFVIVLYDPIPEVANDYAMRTLSTFFFISFGVSNVWWMVFFLFLENSLAKPALMRSLMRALATTLGLATFCTLTTVIDLCVDDVTEWIGYGGYVVACVANILCAGILIAKQARSARKSALVFATVWFATCFLGLLFTTLKVADVLELSNTVPWRVVSFFLSLFFSASLCLSLYLDTCYWRGVARIPVWCSTQSPYDLLDDKLIQNELPLLINCPGIRFIDFAFLDCDKLLACGAASRVYKGAVNVSPFKGTAVAVKVFTPMELTSETLMEFAEEIEKYSKLRHPRVMQVLGVCVRPPDICMVCELCEQGSLLDYLEKNPGLSRQEKLRLSIQVVEGVQFIHSLKPALLHRDIKSQNYLLTKSLDVKLSDFGTSVEILPAQRDPLDAMVGTLLWMSPEVLRGSIEYGLPSDIFSLAIVLWEVWSQQTPYQDVPSKLITSHVLAGNRPPIPDTEWPQDICVLLKEMWAENPDDRPTANHVLERLRAVDGASLC